MKDEKLYIVMLGLPARGKSTLSVRMQEMFRRNHIASRIFNNGNLRRQNMRLHNTSCAEFFHPHNTQGVELRAQFALTNVRRAKTYLRGRGEVAIIDATNVGRSRREMIERELTDHPILYIECQNNDDEILRLSILQKIKSPEFEHMSRDQALLEFEKRVGYYEMIYSPLTYERNYIKIDSLHNRILEAKVLDEMPLYSQIRDFLVTDVVKNLFLIRHTETFYNTEDRIGGDSLLTPRGHQQAQALAAFFKNKKIDYIFTSQKKRTVQTAIPIRDAQASECSIISLTEFGEIDSGVCEGMSYHEIQQTMGDIFLARKKNKYDYIYPGGEGYATMNERIETGIKKAFYLNRNSSRMMIIGHRAVNRMILSHFLYRREEDVPYIYVPQDKFYHIVATQDKKLFELKKYQ